MILCKSLDLVAIIISAIAECGTDNYSRRQIDSRLSAGRTAMNESSEFESAHQSNDLGPPSDSANAGPNRLLEILRRLCLLACCLTAAWLAAYPVNALFRVRAVDFSKLQKVKGRRIAADIQMMGRVR
jgi:hypothetical protein